MPYFGRSRKLHANPSVDPMGKRAVVLSDLEDLALVACDDQVLPALAARDVIASYLSLGISVRDIRGVYGKLYALGLVKPYRERGGKAVVASFEGTRTRDLSFRATRKGVLYLKQPRKRSSPSLQRP